MFQFLAVAIIAMLLAVTVMVILTLWSERRTPTQFEYGNLRGIKYLVWALILVAAVSAVIYFEVGRFQRREVRETSVLYKGAVNPARQLGVPEPVP